MMLRRFTRDMVHVRSAGLLRLRNRLGAIVAGREWNDDTPCVQVQGWVRTLLRERGKVVPGSRREGHNTWTNTGREFLAMLQCIQYETGKTRSDRVAYVGVGVGFQPEDVNVLRLVSPVEYVPGQFLASLDAPPTFPGSALKTVVRYSRTFQESELTLLPGQRVDITELGLFTNGAPASGWTPGSRDTTIGNAEYQAPVAYRSFEPFGKTDAQQLEVVWDVLL